MYIKRIARKRKKYFKKQSKRKKSSFSYNYFSKRYKILFILIIFLFIGFVDFYYAKSHLFNNDIIIESKQYKYLNEIKNKAINQNEGKLLQEINLIKHIYAKKINRYKKGKNIIHITEALNDDNLYKYVTLVSLYSIISNCNKNTFIIFHILCTPDFNESSTLIFKSLFKKFSKSMELIIYNMGNIFLNRKDKRYSQSTYYRILAPLFTNSDRIIHLDGETLTFSDLSEMYNLDFNDNYVLGFYDVLSHGVDYLGLKSNIYINAGVTLFNLKKIKEDNKTMELINMANSNIKLNNVDQTIINYVLYPKIGRLPCKFGTFNFADKSDIEYYLSKLRTKIPIEELEEGIKNPAIVHSVLCYPKIWSVKTEYQKWLTKCGERHNCSCQKYIDIWHSFAKKTEYYEEIAKLTGVTQ